jgi:hypothetical protein
MIRALPTLLVTVVVALLLAGQAHAAGGRYLFDGGRSKQRAQVRAALNASSFDWNVVPNTITVHIAPVGQSYSTPGDIYVDSRLLSARRFSWAVVQDEYAHQIDFSLFDDQDRATLNRVLGGKAWCHGAESLLHSEYGCERFTSTLVWSYWQSSGNAYRPLSKKDESAAMAPKKFKALMRQILNS